MEHNQNIQIVQYKEQSIEIIQAATPSEIDWKKFDTNLTTWVIVSGFFSETELAPLSNHFSFHPLIIEGVAQKKARPAFEEFDDGLFITSSCVNLNEEGDLADTPVFFYLTDHVLISFFGNQCAFFEPIIAKLKNGKPRLKKMKVDYLLNLLLDFQVDHYLLLIESLGEKIETIQDGILEEADSKDIQAIQQMRYVLYSFLRVVWPMREMINLFVMDDSDFISDGVKHFYRDIHSHLYKIADTLETYREMLSGLMDIYLSAINNRLNQVMKILTIVSTIFMPLSFVTGLYGMNFKFMPELSWKYGYPIALVSLLCISLGMLYYFRKKGWL